MCPISLIPNLVTTLLAKLYTFCKSSEAPVVTLSKKTTSALLPPKIKHKVSNNCCFYYMNPSFGKYYAYPKEPLDLGIIVNLTKGSHPSVNQDTTA
jgi:hypothetical protein